MKVRFATIEDSNDILTWRNDSESRKNFKDSSIISEASHKEWFEDKLGSKKARLVVSELNEEKIGVTRFEVEDGSILVSINLSPHSRGKGYGSKMLLLSEEILDFGSKEKEDYYRAEIYKDNIASIKIFEKAGYVLKSSKDNILLYTKLIK